jgi:hypothetical protein
MRDRREVEEKAEEFRSFKSSGVFEEMNAAIYEALNWVLEGEDSLEPE